LVMAVEIEGCEICNSRAATARLLTSATLAKYWSCLNEKSNKAKIPQ